MKEARSRRPSPALVIAMLALFVSLSTTAIGLPGKNKVDKNDLKKGVVKTKNIKANAVKTGKIAPNTINGSDVLESSLGIVPNANALDGKDGKDVVRWVTFNTDGTPGAMSDGVVSTSRPFDPGGYRAVFDRDITGCAAVAQGGKLDGASTGNIRETSVVDTSATEIDVATMSSAGALINGTSTLVVFC